MLRRPCTMMLLCNAWVAGCGAPAGRDPGDTAAPIDAASDDTDTTDPPPEIFVPESTTDSDNDGLPDLVEARLGTSPTDADSDDDGLADGEELSWDHNPTRDDAEEHSDDVGMYVDSPATQRVTMTSCAGSDGDQTFQVAVGTLEAPEGASVAVWRGEAVFVAEITRWVPSANGRFGELRVVVPPEDPRAAWFCGDPDKLNVATSVRRASGDDCVMGGPDKSDVLNGALRDDVPDWITPACVPAVP